MITMKKNYLKQLLATVVLLCCTIVNAQNFEYGGIYYNITDVTNKKVEVIAGENSYSGEVVIPSGVRYYDELYTVTAVANNAFKGCSGLTSITIPGSVTNVGEGAFKDCTGLKELYLEDGTEELYLAKSFYTTYYVTHYGAFYHSPLEKVYLGRDVTYPNPALDPTAPFQNKSTLKSVTIGDKVTKLGVKLFHQCKSIEGQLVIPDNVVTIGEKAFYCCQNITGLELGKNVTTIETDAFFGCSALTGVLTIPNSVKSINGSAFKGCNLTGVNVDNLSDWCRISFANIEANPLHCAGKLYLRGEMVTDLVVPDDITEIRQFAFYNCTSLTSVEFGNNLQTIDDSAFKYCTGLTNVNVPGNVTRINGSAFAYCTNLESATLNEGTLSIGGYAFYQCKKLKSMEIPNSVSSIGTYIFGYCYALENVVIGDGVTQIPDDCFYSCTRFNSLTIGRNVKKIGKLGYRAEANLKTIHISDLSAWCKISFSSGLLGDGGNIYLNGEKITNLVIPDDITEIKPYAFYECRGLSSITIHNNVTSIGNYAFYDCRNFSNLKIGDNVTSIGNYAFYNSDVLASLVIPDKVTTIGDYAFESCSNVRKLTLGSSVKTIKNNAFKSLTNLEELTIFESVKTIEVSAFQGCSRLKSVTSYIPADSLFAPQGNAFQNCNNSNCTLYVPKGAKEKYASTNEWKRFTNIIEMRKSFDLVVTAAEHATLFLDFDTDVPEGVEVYTANSADGDRLKMQQVTGILPANTGVIVKAPAGTYTFTESDGAANAIEGNLLLGSVEDTMITPVEDTKCYVLSMQDGVVGMYGVVLRDGAFKNNANKAYLALEKDDAETSGMERSNSYYFDFAGITAVDAVKTEVDENVYYDLSGRVVEKPACGIYILNGKKVFVK